MCGQQLKLSQQSNYLIELVKSLTRDHSHDYRVHGVTLASFTGLPRFFFSSVCVDNNTLMQQKRGRPGTIHHVIYVCGNMGVGAQLQISLSTDRRSCLESLESQNHRGAFEPGRVDDELIQNMLKS